MNVIDYRQLAIAYFGLGVYQAETVEIIWPSGFDQTIFHPANNQMFDVNYQLSEVFVSDSFEQQDLHVFKQKSSIIN
ncbi:MAG: hypothetical protein Tsb0027_24410 [Wenzhouxiangellaceae bacterium]